MSVTLDEDPVSFLARMRQACPKVLSILNSKQARLLSEDPSKPYDKENANEEYLTEISSYYGLNQKCREAGKDLRGALLKPTIQKKTVDVEDFEAMKEILKKIVERLKLVIESRLVATEEKLGEVYLPRIIRMCRKLKLSKNEIEIATYCLTAQCGYDHEGGRFSSYGVDCLSCCQYLDIPLKDMLEFLNKDRIHMQQGFFPEVQDAYILNSALMYDMDFCKTLMGCRVRSDGFMKLEQTVLADIIVEEPGNDHYRNEDDESPINKQPPKAVGSQDSDEVEEGKGDDPSITGESTEPLGVNLTIPGEIPEADIGELKPKEDHGELDLDTILRLERQKESITVKEEDEGDDINVDEDDPGKLKPYKTDLEYLDDHFKYIMLMIKIKSVDNRMEMEEQFDDEYRQTQRYQRQKREAMTKAKVQDKICKKRLALTKAWVPRLERMVQSRNLCEFEKNVLLTLIGSILQPTKFNNIDAHISNNHVMVGELLRIFCSGLEEQIQHRKYFYKSSSLVREGMIVVHSSGLTGDTSTASVEVDRRMLDFCVGLDTEFSEIVEGSHLYFPKTKFDNVILPKEQKQLILSTVSNFEAYKRCRKKMGLDDAITYGAGMVMLFHGVPGTGKTMMANALANKLNKKVLLINFPSLGTMTAGENFKFIFREAKINDAILFFDECEAIFESREMGGHQVNLLLTEIERHDGLIILATNRPYDLDEAMHRRIMIAIEFRQPDHLLRKAIWESHMPEQMKLADDIDLSELALRFELTGGFIKNAILSALSISVSRDGDSPIIHQKDLLQGANLQLRGRLRMKDFDRRVIPTAGLDEVIVEDSIAKQLKEIVQYEKARAVLFGQWGFAKRNHQGLTILLHGSPGTGKTLVAEAIGYEVGKPLKVVNCGELLSKWVGESSKNINSIFQEARHQDAILVFDEAEGLFGQRTETTTSTDRYANVDVGILLYHIERFPGIIILTTNLIDNIDKAFFRRLRFVLKFDIPKRNLRTKLWKVIIPEEAPLADDVDFERLAHYEMSGGNIKSTVFRAAARAALREEGNRKITMEDLEEASKDEIAKTSTRMGFRRQDSDAVNMYN